MCEVELQSMLVAWWKWSLTVTVARWKEVRWWWWQLKLPTLCLLVYSHWAPCGLCQATHSTYCW